MALLSFSFSSTSSVRVAELPFLVATRRVTVRFMLAFQYKKCGDVSFSAQTCNFVALKFTLKLHKNRVHAFLLEKVQISWNVFLRSEFAASVHIRS